MQTGNPGMFNRYAYTFNDPVNGIDPTGEFTVNVNIKVRHGRVLGVKADVGIKFDSKNLQLSVSPKVSGGFVAGKFQGGTIKFGASSNAPAENSVSAKASVDLGADVKLPIAKATIPGTNIKVSPAVSVSQEVAAVNLLTGEVSGPKPAVVEGGVGKGASIAATVGIEGTANISLKSVPEKVHEVIEKFRE